MTAAYQLTNLQVHYDQQCVLDIPQLSIASGKKVALLGENGAGKSTLLNVLAFTQTISQGEISLLGSPARYPLEKALRKRIGLVGQQPYLLNTSVKANIRLALKLQNIPASQHDGLINQALKLTHATHLIDKKASALSGGELKRVAIARALVYQPDVLLLDEPFAHLDKRSIVQLEHIINAIAQQNRTIVFSTHNQLHSLSIADQTINLVNGKIANTPLLNLFHGRLRDNQFDTGNLIIDVASDVTTARHITIDPSEIIVSHHSLDASLRNQFSGSVSSISTQGATVQLTIDAQEQFHVIISQSAYKQLNIQLTDTLWISFKASSVQLF